MKKCVYVFLNQRTRLSCVDCECHPIQDIKKPALSYDHLLIFDTVTMTEHQV